MRIPARRFFSEAVQTPMHVLLMGREKGDAALLEQGWTGRSVLGFKLPDWQRDFCWTDDQCALFIESVYLGANIGQFMLNCSEDIRFDQILLDGQQRLTSIERYVRGEIAVPGEDGRRWMWPDLGKDEKAHFHRISVPWLRTEYRSEATLREAYDRHNFSGTPHAFEDRATGGSYSVAVPVATRRT